MIDPNVLISAVISGNGAPAAVITALSDAKFDLVISPKLLDELENVLLRPRFRRYLSEGEARIHVSRVRTLGSLVADPPAQTGLRPDPNDDYLVSLARATKADYLVSGDTDLLNLSNACPPVITASAFVSILTQKI